MTVITLFIPESRLTVDRGAVRYVTLTKNSWIGLRQMLRALHGSIPF